MEVNPNTHFTRKEVFMGEEIEAIYKMVYETSK